MGTTNRGPCGCCDPPNPCTDTNACNLISSATVSLPALTFVDTWDVVNNQTIGSSSSTCCENGTSGSDGGFGGSLAGTYVVPFNADPCTGIDYGFANRVCLGEASWGQATSPASGQATGSRECQGGVGTVSYSKSDGLVTRIWLARIAVEITSPFIGSGFAILDYTIDVEVHYSRQRRFNWTSSQTEPSILAEDSEACGSGRTAMSLSVDYSYDSTSDADGNITNCKNRINALIGKATRISTSPASAGSNYLSQHCPNHNTSNRGTAGDYVEVNTHKTASPTEAKSPSINYSGLYGFVQAIQLTSIQ